MKIQARTVFVIIIAVSALAVFSCNREKASNKTIQNLPPEHSKIVESYQKGLSESKNKIVAKVNSVNISMFDLIREMNVVAPQYIKPGQERDAKVDEKVRKEALDRLIDSELAFQEAVKQGLQVPPQLLAQDLQKVRARFKTEDDYKQYLAKSGLSEADLRKQIERGLLINMITEKEIFDKVKIDPELTKKTYSKNKGHYKDPSGKQMSFEAARPLIEQGLMTEAVHKREDAWVGDLKKNARIEITLGESAKGIHNVN